MVDDALISEIFNRLRTRPSGVLSDIDGTLSRIAPVPDAAVVAEPIREALRVLQRHLDLVGVITGRAAHDAERMIGLDGLVYFGNHGMERLHGGELTVLAPARPFVAAIAQTLNAVRQRYIDPHVIFENKGVTGSIHFRLTADPALAQNELLELVTPLAREAGLQLTLGRMIIELRPPVRANKGTALEAVATEHQLRSLIFLGDDLTDLDAMRALASMRRAEKLDGLSIGVVDVESPAEIAATADYTVAGVDSVQYLLSRLAERLAHS